MIGSELFLLHEFLLGDGRALRNTSLGCSVTLFNFLLDSAIVGAGATSFALRLLILVLVNDIGEVVHVT